MVRPKRREASANLLTMIWRSDSLCAMRAQSSANSASRTVFFTVFVLAVSRRRSNREPSSRCRRYTPFSRSLMAWFSTQVKDRLKRTAASTHTCLTPLEMLKGSGGGGGGGASFIRALSSLYKASFASSLQVRVGAFALMTVTCREGLSG